MIENAGGPLEPSSIRRRLSAVSKLYKYGISAEVLTYSPVDHVARPKASEETDSIGLSAAEVRAMLDAASKRSLLHTGLLTLLVYNGLRIDEALGADVADYTHSSGHRVLRITRKGGKAPPSPSPRQPLELSMTTWLADGERRRPAVRQSQPETVDSPTAPPTT